MYLRDLGTGAGSELLRGSNHLSNCSEVNLRSAREPTDIGGPSTAPVIPRSAQDDNDWDGAVAHNPITSDSPLLKKFRSRSSHICPIGLIGRMGLIPETQAREILRTEPFDRLRAFGTENFHPWQLSRDLHCPVVATELVGSSGFQGRIQSEWVAAVRSTVGSIRRWLGFPFRAA